MANSSDVEAEILAAPQRGWTVDDFGDWTGLTHTDTGVQVSFDRDNGRYFHATISEQGSVDFDTAIAELRKPPLIVPVEPEPLKPVANKRRTRKGKATPEASAMVAEGAPVSEDDE